MDTILKIIENYDQREVQKLLKEHKMLDVFNMCITIFCKHYLNKNVWLIKEFTNFIVDIDGKQHIVKNFINIFLLLSKQEYKKIDVFEKQLCLDYKITSLLRAYEKEYSELHKLKIFIHERPYALLNIIFKNIQRTERTIDSIIILKYLLSMKKSEMFKSLPYNCKDVIDFMFLVFEIYNDTYELEKNISEYVKNCRNLFYCRLRQSDKKNRINLLFYTLYVLNENKVKYQETDYNKNEIAKHDKNKTNYLYILNYNNDTLKNRVQYDRDRLKYMNSEIKSINLYDDEKKD